MKDAIHEKRFCICNSYQSQDVTQKFAKSNKKSSQISSEILQEWFYNRAV